MGMRPMQLALRVTLTLFQFIAVRKTLEANMRCATLFPPGRVLWAVRDNDLHPAHRNEIGDSEKLRLFEVLDVEKVFSQIVFAKDMLGYVELGFAWSRS